MSLPRIAPQRHFAFDCGSSIGAGYLSCQLLQQLHAEGWIAVKCLSQSRFGQQQQRGWSDCAEGIRVVYAAQRRSQFNEFAGTHRPQGQVCPHPLRSAYKLPGDNNIKPLALRILGKDNLSSFAGYRFCGMIEQLRRLRRAIQ